MMLRVRWGSLVHCVIVSAVIHVCVWWVLS